jgi:hypothetical protein
MLEDHSANRCIAINCDLGDALAFASEAANLPAWTFFFRKEIKREGDRIRFDTPLGECLTKIRIKHGADWAAACIHSRFASGEESARLRFTRNDAGQTLASFYALFPPNLPKVRRAAMLEQIERELIRLKAILEPGHNRHD